MPKSTTKKGLVKESIYTHEMPKDFTIGRDPHDAAVKQGRPTIYKDAETLERYVEGYFEWLEAHPYVVVDFRGKDSKRVNLPKKRTGTMEGLALFLGVDVATIRAWLHPEGEHMSRPEFHAIMKRARARIYDDRVGGAASGVYNPMIIARLEGLVEKQEVKGKMTIQIGEGDSDL